MRIALVPPLCESVPPPRYGGTERVVAWLADELVRFGHDVTLFASGDSRTAARLIPCIPRAIWRGEDHDASAANALQDELVRERAHEFDVIHFHTDATHLALADSLHASSVTTLHYRLDVPETLEALRAHPDVPLVSISEAQRGPLPDARWLATVYHGLPPDSLAFYPSGGDDLVFLGRISPEKGLHDAIAIADATGMRLRIAAKVPPDDDGYFAACVGPRLEDGRIDYVGEIDDAEKSGFLGRARALLFPIDWPEPFGLVLIEALACGTPVIAFDRGAVPEIVEDGVTGFIVESVEGAIAAVRRVDELDRERCRQEFERRFTVERMARDYVAVYGRLIESGLGAPTPSGASAG